MNYFCFVLWFIFLDFPKELSKPGIIFHASLFSLVGGIISQFFLKGSSWISVAIIFLVIVNDFSNLFFGIKFESCFFGAAVYVLLWFFKAFHSLYAFSASILFFVGLVKNLINEEKKTHSVFIILGALIICFLPADISLIVWVFFLHLPASLKQSEDYASQKYLFFCFCLLLFANWAFPSPGKITSPMTVTYIFFRGYLYLV